MASIRKICKKKHARFKSVKPKILKSCSSKAALQKAPQAEVTIKIVGKPYQIGEHLHVSAPFENSEASITNKHANQGKWFEVSINKPSGTEQVFVSHDLIDVVNENPTAFIEKHFGLGYSDYLQWVRNNGSVQCSQIKKDGERCTKMIGGANLHPKHFAALNGQCCGLHKGIKATDIPSFLKENVVGELTATNYTHYDSLS